MLKRRRMNGSESVDCSAEFKTTYMMTSIGGATTMQSSSSFSYNGKSGFVSAASQMQLVEDERFMYGSSNALLGESILPSKANNDNKPKPQQEQQRNLLNMWGGNKHNAKYEGSVSLDMLEEEDYQEAVRASVETQAQVSNDQSDVTLRNPLSALPQAFAAHRLPVTSITRPALTIHGDEPAKKQYVFLSSSPPPEQGVPQAVEVQDEDQMPLSPMSHLNEKDKSTDIRPAMTFHSTTVSQVSAASRAPRKTLGVRRSMNGWSTKAPQGFSVPRRSGATSRGQ